MACTISTPCPTPNVTDGMVGLFQYTNTITDGGFAWLIVMMTFIISYTTLSFRGYPMGQTFPAALFLSTLISVMFVVMNMLDSWVMLLMLVGTVASAAILNLRRD